MDRNAHENACRGVEGARTSKQAHLQHHIMRVLRPVGPHHLAWQGRENVGTIMKAELKLVEKVHWISLECKVRENGR